MSDRTHIEESTSAYRTGKTYLRATQKYYHLKIFQQIATLSTSFVEMLLVGSLSFFALIFAAISGALALGKYLQSNALGYLIVAGIFILLAILILSFRKRLFAFVLRKLSKTYFG